MQRMTHTSIALLLKSSLLMCFHRLKEWVNRKEAKDSRKEEMERMEWDVMLLFPVWCLYL